MGVLNFRNQAAKRILVQFEVKNSPLYATELTHNTLLTTAEKQT